MEWVEVRGKSVEVAVTAGLAELGLASPDEAEIEVLQEPERGFLGIGGQDAIVRIKQAPKRRRRRRGRGKGSKKDEGSGGKRSGSGDRERSRQERGGGGSGSDSTSRKRSGDRGQRESAERGDGSRKGRQRDGGDEDRRSGGQEQGDRRRPRSEQRGDRRGGRGADQGKTGGAEVAEEVDIEQQREIVQEFLEGLVEAFGVEGAVTTSVDDTVILAEITGEQTEALVGQKGAVLQSVLELCRTVVQRKSQAGARIRLDIAGYQERRREALRIYAQRLAEKVIEEGGEIMLEPMNAAERKVVHDAIVEVDGVRTFSEGQDPNRSVVIAPE